MGKAEVAVRRAAAEALGLLLFDCSATQIEKVTTKHAEPIFLRLVAAINDADPQVRWNSCLTVARIAKSGLAGDIVRVLEEAALQDPDRYPSNRNAPSVRSFFPDLPLPSLPR